MKKISKNHLKEVAKLQQKKYRQLNGKMVVEGLRLVSQLQAYNYKLLEVYTTSETFGLADFGATIYLLDEAQMTKICDTKHPQSLAAMVEIPQARIEDNNFLLYLDKITDPGNMGTIFRTAAAAGVDGIILSEECVDPFNPKSIRASLGAVFGIPYSIKDDKWLIDQEHCLVTTALENSEDIFKAEIPTEKVILILGSEANGVRSSILKASHKIVKIPHYGKIESMNVGVAAGIAMFEICRKRYQKK